ARELGLALLLGLLREPRAEDLERRLLVRGLAALVLDGDDDARRQVRDPYRRIGLVHVLAARARRPERVDAQIVVVELDVGGLVEERRDDHLREARVSTVRLVEWAQSHEPVLATLGLEDAVGVLTLDGERRRLDPVLLARARLEHLGLEA